MPSANKTRQLVALTVAKVQTAFADFRNMTGIVGFWIVVFVNGLFNAVNIRLPIKATL
jgi:hypothetical protein